MGDQQTAADATEHRDSRLADTNHPVSEQKAEYIHWKR